MTWLWGWIGRVNKTNPAPSSAGAWSVATANQLATPSLSCTIRLPKSTRTPLTLECDCSQVGPNRITSLNQPVGKGSVGLVTSTTGDTLVTIRSKHTSLWSKVAPQQAPHQWAKIGSQSVWILAKTDGLLSPNSTRSSPKTKSNKSTRTNCLQEKSSSRRCKIRSSWRTKWNKRRKNR